MILMMMWNSYHFLILVGEATNESHLLLISVICDVSRQEYRTILLVLLLISSWPLILEPFFLLKLCLQVISTVIWHMLLFSRVTAMNYQVSNIHFVFLMFDGRLDVYGNACQIFRSCRKMHVVCLCIVCSPIPYCCLLAWIDYFSML